MQPSPQPHPQPQTLDDLIANAEHFADFCMRNSGSVTPALFFLGPAGQGMFCPASLADDSAKDDFANHARLVCITRLNEVTEKDRERLSKYLAAYRRLGRH